MTKEFMDAWRIVKHKGPVMLPSVKGKVYRAMEVVKPYLDYPDWFELHHEIGDHEVTNVRNRNGFDGVCRDIEIKLGIHEPQRRKKTWYGANTNNE